MIFLPSFIGIISIIFYLFYRFNTPPFRFLLIDSFYMGLCIYFIGSIIASIWIIPDYSSKIDVLWLSTLCLVSSSIFVTFLSPNNILSNNYRHTIKSSISISSITFFIILFNISFAYLVYRDLFQGELGWERLLYENTLMSARKTITSGDSGYYFPGLIKQIRDIIAPAFILYMISSFPRLKKIHIILLTFSTLLAIFFGGQRGPLLALFFALFAGNYVKNKRFGKKKIKVSRFRLLSYLTITFILMGIFNQLLGRSIDPDASFSESMFNTIFQISYRLFAEVPSSNILAYDFIANQNFGIGTFWFNDLKSLLPGTQEGFSNILHSYLGGSLAGNAVLGFPLSAYINFGILGVIFAPLFFISILHYIDLQCSIINTEPLMSIRMIMFVYLPLSYDPTIFLLNGGLILISIFAFESFKYQIRNRKATT